MNVTKVKTAIVALQEAIGTLEISADVTMTTEAPMFSTSENGNISNGEVHKDTQVLARFSSQSDILTINFLTGDTDERNDIQQAVSAFCTNARTYIDNASVNVTEK